jgi:hypothetical protein
MLFLVYWVGSRLPPGSPCLTDVRDQDACLSLLKSSFDPKWLGSESRGKAGAEFVSAYKAASKALNLPPLPFSHRAND